MKKFTIAGFGSNLNTEDSDKAIRYVLPLPMTYNWKLSVSKSKEIMKTERN